MIQLLISWLMSVGLWLISMISQIVLLLPQLLFKPNWISQGSQWVLKTLMEDSDDSTKDVLKSWYSHAKHSIKHPHPPLTRDVQILISLSLVVFIWSVFQPYDRFTWSLEVAPLIVISMILAGIFYRLPFTKLFYWLFFFQGVMILVGAHYTYEQVPLGEWLQNGFNLSRNPYDRIGHFVQGLVTVIFAREVLMRTSKIKKGAWLFILSVCLSFVVSALYELLEWGAASMYGSDADAFLGFQGDTWDMQWDILMGLIGSLVSIPILSKLHDRQYMKLSKYLERHPVDQE